MLNLVDIIPAEWRKPIYAVYAVLGVILGAIQVAMEPDPTWLTTTMSVYAFVGAAIGFVASANTVPTKAVPFDEEIEAETEAEEYEV